jgi:hypothetical protein
MAQTATITLLTGDYPDRLNTLWQAAQAAKEDKGELLAGEEHPFDVLAREYADLKAEAEENGLRVVIKAVGRREWRRLKEAHPPRTDGDPEVVKGDRLAGVNTSTVEDDLVHASLLEPAFSSRAAYDDWADDLSEGEFQTILRRAWELANIAQYDPKSLPASPTRSNGES